MSHIIESTITILSEGSKLEGKILLDQTARIHGTLAGEIRTTPGSSIILGETAVVEGNIDADTVLIDGFVRGNIKAKAKVVISGSGQVIGDIETPSLIIDFGAHFEGRCLMPETASSQPVAAFKEGLSHPPA